MKTIKYFIMAALVAVGAILASCVKEEQLVETTVEDNIVVCTATINLTGEGTKALSSSGDKRFAEGDKIAVVYKNTSGNTVKAESQALTIYDIHGGKSADFTVTLTNPDKEQNVTYVYPAVMAKDNGTLNYEALATQDGTLASLASNLDCCTKSGAWNGDKLPSLTLDNQLAILACRIFNSAETPAEVTGSITNLVISDGTNKYTVNRETGAGPIYVAILPTASADITMNAKSATTNYTKSLTGKTYEASNGYNVSWKMIQGTNLSLLSADHTANDGDVLTGTLGANVKVSIANAATVTLDGVTINGVNVDSKYFWAGLTCEGDATIILKVGTTNTITGFRQEYPGLYVPNGKTLTIQGAGTLIASANGSGSAGIGGGSYNTLHDHICGNIVIQGGTITATGGERAAGIGSGQNSSCGNITITAGVTKVTAIKGNSSNCSIGFGSGGSCGTVTIGGTVHAGGINDDSYTYIPGAGSSTKDLSTVSADYTATNCETLTGTLGANVKISIADGATVTLDGVTINGVNVDSKYFWAGLTCEGDATIILKVGTTNTIRGFREEYPGIYVPTGKTLTIQGAGTLIASANGSGSAGIGGGSNSTLHDHICGNIVIQGGTITATGGGGAAGIGSGQSSSCGNITITTGVTSVTAIKGNSSNCSIGFGLGGSCGTVTIGGTVYPTGISTSPYTYPAI